jgi:ribosome-associated heat shock protein Hsp15
MTETEKLRLDKYLWSIRIFKTRAMAAAACEKGKVRYMGGSAKASKKVSENDEYEIKTEARNWVIRVTGLLDQRVQFSEAVKFYLDLTPAEETDKLKFQAASFHTGKRLSKLGRPTKKDKRDLEDFLDSGENPT